MEKEKLIQLISQPQTITRSDVASLKELAKQHPYFQAVFALIAKGTQQPEDIQAAAVRTANRMFLRQLMDSDFNPSYHLPDLKGLDIQPEDLNAFDKLSHLNENPVEIQKQEELKEEHIPPHHLTVNVVHGEEKESVEVDVQLPEDTTEKAQDLDFEGKENQDEFEKYWEIAEHPEKIEEIALQKVEESVFKEETPINTEDTEKEDTNQISNIQDEDALRQHLQNAMEEIKRLRAEAREVIEQKTEETFAQNPMPEAQDLEQENAILLENSESESAIEQSVIEQPNLKEETHQEKKISTNTPPFNLPNYEMNYSYEEIDKIPYLQEDQTLDEKSSEGMTIFKDKEEIERLQKIALSIQQESKANESKMKEEANANPTSNEQETSVKSESEMPVYQDAGFSINPDFFELHQIIANQEETKQVHKTVNEQQKLSPQKGTLAWERQKGIIDKFISIEPQLKIKVSEESQQPISPKDNLAVESEVSRFQASENLAMILKRQGKIERAIQIYEDLILKYPEKRGYFAAQIEKARTEN